MTENDFLLLVRGPLLTGATIIFLLGVVLRLFEILLLGRKRDLAQPRGSALKGGLRTVIMRSVASSCASRQARS